MERQAENRFLINAYNALTLEAIISNYPIKSSLTASLLYSQNSIRQIPGVWDRLYFLVMGREMTLNHIEHEILRKHFDEPRIHLALVCAAMGCPPLRNDPYDSEWLDEQLDDQARRFLSNPLKFRIDRDKRVVYLSSIFKWYGEDFVKSFGQDGGSSKHSPAEQAVLNHIGRYLNADDRGFLVAGSYDIKYLDYDWSLNEQGANKMREHKKETTVELHARILNFERPQNRNVQSRGLWRPALLLIVVIAALVIARLFGIGERLSEMREWIESLGAWGPVAFISLYIVAVVLALPGSALTIAAGALFGSVLGITVVSIGSTIGSSLSFLIARYFARDAVAQWLSKNDRFRKLDQLTQKHGAIIVALTRLVPFLPFNLLNYGFGITRVPFWTYVFWSWLCMLPGTALYVVGADAFTSGISQGKISWLLVTGLAAVAIMLAMLVRYATRKLRIKQTIEAEDAYNES
jgi:uncharacterized membrane protein YdjX (TVP38/TMEM64 family)